MGDLDHLFTDRPVKADPNWELVKALAACDEPVDYWGDDQDYGDCALCGARVAEAYWDPPGKRNERSHPHAESCPWATAKRLVAEADEFRRTHGLDGEDCGYCIRCDEAKRVTQQSVAARLMRRFPMCPECGNKRCPKSTWHGNACTRSNEPGQPGSDYVGGHIPRLNTTERQE